jgi:hypothetical protein
VYLEARAAFTAHDFEVVRAALLHKRLAAGEFLQRDSSGSWRPTKAEHERLKADGVMCPWVFNRPNRKVKGKRIATFITAFEAACTRRAARVGYHMTCGGPPTQPGARRRS